MATWSNDSKNTATFSNDTIYQYLLKDDGAFLLKDDDGLIIIETSIGSEVFAKDSKNTATFTNETRN